MTEEVLISIKGLQTLEGMEDGEVEVITAGVCHSRDGKHIIKYDEAVEGAEGSITNLVRIQPGSLEVTKKGLTNAHLVFEEKKKNMTCYETPFGNLLVGITATKVDVAESEETLDVQVDYALDINHRFVADCSLSMNVKAKNKEVFHLE